MKSIFYKMVFFLSFKHHGRNLEQVAEDEDQDVIGDDENNEIVRASRSKRTRRIDSSDCHKAAQKSVYVLKNAIYPTDVVLDSK